MIMMITGGAGNGKSYFAEKLCNELPGPRYYVAAMRPFGEDSLKRIEKHQKNREPFGYLTFEQYTNVDKVVLPQKGNVLLECLCNLTANEMFDEAGNFKDPFDSVITGVKTLASQCENLIVVTNDVGGDALFYDEKSRAYVEALGKINAYVARLADQVYEVVCGIPIPLKSSFPGGTK